MATESNPNTDEFDFIQYVSNWIHEAKGGLMQIGINVKNMTQEANHLVAAMSQSRETLQQLDSKMPQEKIQEQIEMALRAYEDVARASQELSRHLTLVTESMMNEAKHMQTLKNKIEVLQRS